MRRTTRSEQARADALEALALVSRALHRLTYKRRPKPGYEASLFADLECARGHLVDAARAPAKDGAL